MLQHACAFLLALLLTSTLALAQDPEPEEDDSIIDSPVYTVLNEQLILIATIVAAIAALPPLIEFWIERRKRRERIDLSIDDHEVATLAPRVAGMDELLAGVADLVDRARDPARYPTITVGNEVLILGPNLSGKKTLAQRIAKDARLDRLITVYNSRSADALSEANRLVRRYRNEKVMLLLPRIDAAFEKEDEEVITELEALIETTSEKANVLVVGTAVSLKPDSPLDNAFGIKIVLPGTRQAHAEERVLDPAQRRVLVEVARFYLRQAEEAGATRDGMSEDAVVDRVLAAANSPAEIEDIFAVSRTLALYRKHSGRATELMLTPDILDTAIDRVIVGAIGSAAETSGD